MLFVTLSGLVLLAVGANLAWRGLGALGAGAFAAAGFVMSTRGVFFSSAMAIDAVLLFVLAVICMVRQAPEPTFRVWSVAAAGISLVAALLLASWETYQSVQIQRQHPLESLAGRLEYETKNRSQAQNFPATIGAEETPSLGPATGADFLADLELRLKRHESFRHWRRSEALSQVHEGATRQFIRGPGIGAGRFSRVPLRAIELPQPPSLRLAQSESGPSSSSPEDANATATARPAADPIEDPIALWKPDEAELWRSHVDNVLNFVNRPGFGYVRDLDHVAGFEHHGFRRIPNLELGDDTYQTWQLVNLELVSLLKYDDPRVYVSPHLPRMDELRDAPTRSLDAFEQEAMKSLAAGNNLVVDGRSHRIRMLGSIRAVGQCRQCHRVSDAELLGAFSYEVVRSRPESADQLEADAGWRRLEPLGADTHEELEAEPDRS